MKNLNFHLPVDCWLKSTNSSRRTNETGFPPGIIQVTMSHNAPSTSAYCRDQCAAADAPFRYQILLQEILPSLLSATETEDTQRTIPLPSPAGLQTPTQADESLSLLYPYEGTLGFRDNDTRPLRKHRHWFENTERVTKLEVQTCDTDSCGVVSLPERQMTSYSPLS